jgi:uncharacterized protein (TIGR03643 family)
MITQEDTSNNNSKFPTPIARLENEKLEYIKHLSDNDLERIIEMAWEDRTPFDAIKFQFKLSESQVKNIMKTKLKFSSYKLWRKRVKACKTKHAKLRSDDIKLFKCSLQRHITLNKISKRHTK